jgi:hypothetical protein
MVKDADAFLQLMRRLLEIKKEIQHLSDERRELLHALSEGHDSALVAKRQEIDDRLAELWDAYRAERARVRFGERDIIIARARHEERLERAAASEVTPRPTMGRLGALAQLGERRLCKPEVAGSIPARSIR